MPDDAKMTEGGRIARDWQRMTLPTASEIRILDLADRIDSALAAQRAELEAEIERLYEAVWNVAATPAHDGTHYCHYCNQKFAEQGKGHKPNCKVAEALEPRRKPRSVWGHWEYDLHDEELEAEIGRAQTFK